MVIDLVPRDDALAEVLPSERLLANGMAIASLRRDYRHIESWRNINAIDDVVLEILNTKSHLVVAGVCGNAGAGGVGQLLIRWARSLGARVITTVGSAHKAQIAEESASV